MLSLVVSAYNEEKNLKECLKSASFADEIIVIDNQSLDNTNKIAREFTSSVFVLPNNLMLNINKNIGFDKAKGDWIINLDADERITKELKNEILDIISSNTGTNGWWIPRKNIIFGKWIEHGIWWPDYQLRLFRKGKGKFPCVSVHEYLKVEGNLEKLNNPLIHHNYESISQFINKVNLIYTENEAENFLRDKKDISWQNAITLPINDFLKTYFKDEGFKDGFHGLILSILQAFYTFIVFAKAWEKKGFTQKYISVKEGGQVFSKISKDSNYWLSTAEINDKKNPLMKLFLKIKRRIFYV